MDTVAPAEVIIGLDVGTTRVKAAAVALDGAWSRLAIRGYPLLEPAPDHQVQDPDAIITATADAVREVVAASGSAEVVAVSLSAAMHGLVGFDADRRPVTPLITWADARSRAEARELHRSGQAADLHIATGVPVHPMTPLTKLIWFVRHDRATWDRVRWWGGLKDLLLLWSTGSLVTELSSASGTGMLDMSTRTWSVAALDLCGLTADRLAPIEPTTAARALAPEAAAQTGLPAGTPVVVGAADGPLGNLGTGAMAPGVAGLSLGTSGAVRVAVDAPRVDPDRALFCLALTEQVWVVGGAISNGGGVVRWAGGSLAPDVQPAAGGEEADADAADAAVLDLAAKVPAGSDGLVMLPYLLAERAPLWDLDLPGAYLGLRRGHTREYLVRAAVEGVCLQMRLVLDRLDAVEPVTSVRATGGVFQARLWRDVMAAVLGRPLAVVDGADGTARGAAALALFAVGRAATLAGAAEQLAAGGAAPPLPVEVDRDLVSTYDRLRASVPGMIGRLAPVAGLFDPSAAVEAPPPPPMGSG
jgi:gluconokinase